MINYSLTATYQRLQAIPNLPEKKAELTKAFGFPERVFTDLWDLIPILRSERNLEVESFHLNCLCEVDRKRPKFREASDVCQHFFCPSIERP